MCLFAKNVLLLKCKWAATLTVSPSDTRAGGSHGPLPAIRCVLCRGISVRYTTTGIGIQMHAAPVPAVHHCWQFFLFSLFFSYPIRSPPNLETIA